MIVDIEHFTAILNIAIACREINANLPQTDIVLEMRNLLDDQMDIIQCFLAGKHYGSFQLEQITMNCQNIIHQIKCMGESE